MRNNIFKTVQSSSGKTLIQSNFCTNGIRHSSADKAELNKIAARWPAKAVE